MSMSSGLAEQVDGVVPEQFQQWIVDVDDHTVLIGDQHTVGDAIEHHRPTTQSTVVVLVRPSAPTRPLSLTRVSVYMSSVSTVRADRETAECPDSSGPIAFDGAGQQFEDLGVADGVEISIPTSDGAERIRLRQAHDVVGDRPQSLDDVGGCHGRGHDDPLRSVCSGDLYGSTHRCAGRDSVVDDDGAASHKVCGGVASLGSDPSERSSSRRSRCSTSANCASSTRVDRRTSSLTIDDAVLTDRSHGEFGLPRNAELADHDHVQWSTDRRGDFGGHRNPTARQTQHHRTVELLLGNLGAQQHAG